jgi:hypothetical protein
VDGEGHSFVDLYSQEVQWQAEVPLVRGLGDTQHVLRLTSSDKRSAPSRGERCAVDAFIVATPNPPAFPFAAIALFSIVALASGGALYWATKG